MPKYSARIMILREDKLEEELLLESFHARGQIPAEELVEFQSREYIRLQPHAPAYGYKVMFVMRTSLLDRLLAKGEAPRSALNPDGTVVKKQRPDLKAPLKIEQVATLKVIDKFSEETKGDFSDPFTFAKGLIHTLKYY